MVHIPTKCIALIRARIPGHRSSWTTQKILKGDVLWVCLPITTLFFYLLVMEMVLWTIFTCLMEKRKNGQQFSHLITKSLKKDAIKQLQWFKQELTNAVFTLLEVTVTLMVKTILIHWKSKSIPLKDGFFYTTSFQQVWNLN